MSKSWQSKLKEAFKRHNGTAEDLLFLAQPVCDSFIDKTAEELVAFSVARRSAFIVPVDYDLSHTKQVEDARFDWITNYRGNMVLENPTNHLYPLPSGQLPTRMTLIHLNRSAKKKTIITRMNKLGVRPVLSPEFLALIKALPNLLRQFPLVCLGSIWVRSFTNPRVLHAYEDSDGHNLDLGWTGAEWGPDCRFAAVCL